MFTNRTIVLGVTGSIAAYKIASLASMLVKQHASVHLTVILSFRSNMYHWQNRQI